jgi:hypothetical protein
MPQDGASERDSERELTAAVVRRRAWRGKLASPRSSLEPKADRPRVALAQEGS